MTRNDWEAASNSDLGVRIDRPCAVRVNGRDVGDLWYAVAVGIDGDGERLARFAVSGELRRDIIGEGVVHNWRGDIDLDGAGIFVARNVFRGHRNQVVVVERRESAARRSFRVGIDLPGTVARDVGGVGRVGNTIAIDIDANRQRFARGPLAGQKWREVVGDLIVNGGRLRVNQQFGRTGVCGAVTCQVDNRCDDFVRSIRQRVGGRNAQ